jgi:hypothetical protein
MCGSDEPLIPVGDLELAAQVGRSPVTAQWRKPLRLDEIARMAPTPEVRERRGRP